MRRRPVLMAVGALTLAGLGGGAALLGGDGGAGAQDDPESTAPTSTATVERTDLVEYEDLDGTLGFGTLEELSVARPGTITGLPAEGTVVDRGGSLAEVDGLPVVLLLGDKPFWRPLQVDMDGPDVQILEENLVALGYADASSLAVDEDFTSATTAAVKRWQKALGMEQTGVVALGDAVVRPAPVRVADQLATLGSSSGGPVLKVSGTEQHVTVTLEATRQSLVAVGDEVTVELPDGTSTPATVASVGSVVTPGDEMSGTSATVEVIVALTDPSVAGSLDEAPVDVSIVSSQAEGVLAVPVEALLALAEGGYAVERVTADGGTELVAVETGAFADGLVEITGDVAEGDEVVVPG